MASRSASSDSITAQARRLSLLLATLDQWLQAGGSVLAARRVLLREIEPALSLWLVSQGADWRGDCADRLAQFLTSDRTLPTWPSAPTASALATAMARACLAQAGDEVEHEARRAGHGGAFEAMRPYLEADLPADSAQRLGAALGLSEAAVKTAFNRLRRRFRQRVESGLALWSNTPEQRLALRQRLHAALTGQESSP